MDLEEKYETILIKIFHAEKERLELTYVEKRPQLKSDLQFLINSELVEFDKTDKAYYLLTEGYKYVEEYNSYMNTGEDILKLESQDQSLLSKFIYYTKLGIYLIVVCSIVVAIQHVRKAPNKSTVDKAVLESATIEIMDKLDLVKINEAWNWTGIVAQEVIKVNQFGNIIFKDEREDYYRITPEELAIDKIASNDEEYLALLNDNKFVSDWEMKHFVTLAKSTLGELEKHEKYCLKIPGVIGGKYSADNFAKISFLELIAVSGDLAYQIKDLEDGDQVELKIVN